MEILVLRGGGRRSVRSGGRYKNVRCSTSVAGTRLALRFSNSEGTPGSVNHPGVGRGPGYITSAASPRRASCVALIRLRRLGGRGSVRGSPCDEPARLRTGLQGSIPSDPGIQVRLRRLGGQGFVRGSPCSEPARLRFTSLRPPSCGGSALPSWCTASAGTEPWRPASLCPPFFLRRGYPRECS
jgi:hypothetical protein